MVGSRAFRLTLSCDTWRRCRRLLPAEVARRAATVTPGSSRSAIRHAMHNQSGLQVPAEADLQEQQTAYNDLVETLAEEIIDAADANPRAAAARPCPQLAVVPPRSRAPARARRRRSPPRCRARPGRSTSRFVYVAADPNAFGAGARRSSRTSTRAARTGSRSIRTTRRACTASCRTSSPATSSASPATSCRSAPNLIDEHRRRLAATPDRRPDRGRHGACTGTRDQYRDLLKQLDGRLDYHWCVLVPWNEHDADSRWPQRERSRGDPARTFDRHANLAPNPMFFRDGISSAGELKAALREVLTSLKEEIKKRAQVRCRFPPVRRRR